MEKDPKGFEQKSFDKLSYSELIDQTTYVVTTQEILSNGSLGEIRTTTIKTSKVSPEKV